MVVGRQFAGLVVHSFVVALSRKVGQFFGARPPPFPCEQKNTNPSLADDMGEHFIICGFGRTGQAIAGILRALQVPYIAVEDDYQILRAVGGTDNVIYGESDRVDSMTKAGIAQARALIVTFMEAPRVISTVQLARTINPDIYILVKAASVSQAEVFSEAGADDALVESHESGFSLASIAARKIFAANRICLTPPFIGRVFEKTVFSSVTSGRMMITILKARTLSVAGCAMLIVSGKN